MSTLEQALAETTARAVRAAIAPLVDEVSRLRAEVEALRSDPDQELTVREAAQLAGVSPKTLDERRRLGGGPVFRRVGRHVTYRRGDLLEWINARPRARNNQPAAPARRA